MQSAKLTDKIDETTGEIIFEIGKVVEIKREDYKEQEEKLISFKEFLERVTEVNTSQLNKKFSI